MAPIPPLFEFEAVTVEREGHRLVGPLTATIPTGGVTVLMGPSGAGKSTLLRLCNRLEVAAEGTVRFRGRDLDDYDVLALRREVGMVFQRPTPFAGTVRDNLEVATPEATDAEMGRALGRAGLDRSFLEREALALSGGEAQRVCLARTLVTEPRAVLMDEPTSSLDARAARLLERLGCELAGAGTPVLWVTHDPAQMRRIADHVLVLDEGHLRAEGPPDVLGEAQLAGLELDATG